IPERILNPELRAGLLAAAQANGIDPSHLRVGSGRNSINPQTGQMEFDDTVRDDNGMPVENVTVAATRGPMDTYLDGRSLDDLRGMQGWLQSGISAVQTGRDAAAIRTAAAAMTGVGAPLVGPGAAITAGLAGTRYGLGRLQDHVNQRIRDIEDEE